MNTFSRRSKITPKSRRCPTRIMSVLTRRRRNMTNIRTKRRRIEKMTGRGEPASKYNPTATKRFAGNRRELRKFRRNPDLRLRWKSSAFTSTVRGTDTKSFFANLNCPTCPQTASKSSSTQLAKRLTSLNSCFKDQLSRKRV